MLPKYDWFHSTICVYLLACLSLSCLIHALLLQEFPTYTLYFPTTRTLLLLFPLSISTHLYYIHSPRQGDNVTFVISSHFVFRGPFLYKNIKNYCVGIKTNISKLSSFPYIHYYYIQYFWFLKKLILKQLYLWFPKGIMGHRHCLLWLLD